MDAKKIVFSGLAAGFLGFLAGSIFYMFPPVMNIYTEYGDWPGAKPVESFGGFGSWMVLMLLGSLVGTVLLAILYSYTEKGIKIRPIWKKGAFFGFLIWLAYSLLATYAAWLMYTVPGIILVVNIFGDLFSSLVTGIAMAVVYQKVK